MEAGQIEIQKALNTAFVQIKVKNPNISLRAFANRLSISPSSISEILNGKRRVSKKLAEKIVTKLQLDPSEQSSILKHFDLKKEGQLTGSTKNITKQTTQLDSDSFKSISEWYHFAILSLAETRDFKPESEWIANRLNIKVSKANAAIERLLRLGMFKEANNGKLVLAKAQYRTSDEIASLALKKAHATNLELAKESLINDPIDKRDFNAMTMAIDVNKLPEAKELIREFKEKMCDILESGHKSEVYKVCIQLFPLSNVKEEVHQ
jgi:uncharacterized protein (TIGR02147 family)